MNIISFTQFALLFIAVIVLHVVWAKYRIKQWALRNDYVINKCKICLTDIGPFSYFGTSGGQSVFKVEAVNSEGEIEKGYARAGGFFFGLLRKRVEVKWDRKPLGE
ncbi:MAG: hypothetical protein OEU91_03030 [Gammaproteobacteria bacterium]|nr:hypothetical protein [Gammaproteobacteria bacterium]